MNTLFILIIVGGFAAGIAVGTMIIGELSFRAGNLIDKFIEKRKPKDDSQ
jgi:uncharacterized membrane-anchored protein YitT (DUF2179 family)